MAELKYIDEVSAEVLDHIVRQVLSLVKTKSPKIKPDGAQPGHTRVVALVPTGGIAARSGATMTGVKCKLFWDKWISDSSRTLEAIALPSGDQMEEYVFNLDPVDSVPAGKIIVIDTLAGGAFYAHWESCNDETSTWW